MGKRFPELRSSESAEPQNLRIYDESSEEISKVKYPDGNFGLQIVL